MLFSWKWIVVVLSMLSLWLNLGCAAERAASKTIEMAGAIGTAIIEKSHITQSELSADASLNNPHYRVLALMVQGVLLDIGLDGVQVNAGARGSGSGEDKPLSEATTAAIRERLNDPGFVAKLGEAIAKRVAEGSFRVETPAADSSPGPALLEGTTPPSE